MSTFFSLGFKVQLALPNFPYQTQQYTLYIMQTSDVDMDITKFGLISFIYIKFKSVFSSQSLDTANGNTKHWLLEKINAAIINLA